METEFAVNEQSIQDMVQRAVRQELTPPLPVRTPEAVKVIDPTLEAVKMTDPAPKTRILAKVVTEGIPHLPANLPAIAHKTDAAAVKTTETAKTTPR